MGPLAVAAPFLPVVASSRGQPPARSAMAISANRVAAPLWLLIAPTSVVEPFTWPIRLCRSTRGERSHGPSCHSPEGASRARRTGTVAPRNVRVPMRPRNLRRTGRMRIWQAARICATWSSVAGRGTARCPRNARRDRDASEVACLRTAVGNDPAGGLRHRDPGALDRDSVRIVGLEPIPGAAQHHRRGLHPGPCRLPEGRHLPSLEHPARWRLRRGDPREPAQSIPGRSPRPGRHHHLGEAAHAHEPRLHVAPGERVGAADHGDPGAHHQSEPDTSGERARPVGTPRPERIRERGGAGGPLRRADRGRSSCG